MVSMKKNKHLVSINNHMQGMHVIFMVSTSMEDRYAKLNSDVPKNELAFEM